MSVDYERFLQSKAIIKQPTGKQVDKSLIHPIAFPFQRDAISWAVSKGKAALFLDTGLGKTICQLERKFLGIELKPEYFNVAKHNLENAQSLNGQDLFAWAKQQQETEVIEEA